MKARIYSYKLPELSGPFTLRLPLGARILQVSLGSVEQPTLAVQVMPDRDVVVRSFVAAWMGQDTDAMFADRFLGSVHLKSGPAVHYFEQCNRRLGFAPCQCEPPCPH